MKKLIFMIIGLLILSMLLFACNSKTDNIENVISDYYSVHQPQNIGELKILSVTDRGKSKGQFVFVEKYMGDGEINIDLFVVNVKMEIECFTTFSRSISPCFSVNSAVLNNEFIVFGDYKSSMFDVKSEKIIDVEPFGIEFILDNDSIKHDFINDETYLCVLGQESVNLVDAYIYDSSGKTISTMSRDTIYSTKEFQTVQ